MTSLGYFFVFMGYIPLILLTLYRFKDTSKLWKISSIVLSLPCCGFLVLFLCFFSQLSNWKKWINILCTAIDRLYHPYSFINFFAVSKQCVWKKSTFIRWMLIMKITWKISEQYFRHNLYGMLDSDLSTSKPISIPKDFCILYLFFATFLLVCYLELAAGYKMDAVSIRNILFARVMAIFQISILIRPRYFVSWSNRYYRSPCRSLAKGNIFNMTRNLISYYVPSHRSS